MQIRGKTQRTVHRTRAMTAGMPTCFVARLQQSPSAVCNAATNDVVAACTHVLLRMLPRSGQHELMCGRVGETYWSGWLPKNYCCARTTVMGSVLLFPRFRSADIALRFCFCLFFHVPVSCSPFTFLPTFHVPLDISCSSRHPIRPVKLVKQRARPKREKKKREKNCGDGLSCCPFCWPTRCGACKLFRPHC